MSASDSTSARRDDNSSADPSGTSSVVMQQPGAVPVPPGGAVAWMPMPRALEGVPPGLEYLTMVDHITVEQLVDMFEVVTHWEIANKYVLKNKNRQKVYFAMEESSTLGRMFAKNKREFTMHIVDNMNREVIRVHRPFKLIGFSECEVEAPVGHVVAKLHCEMSCGNKEFVISDRKGRTVFRVVGPQCAQCGCDDKIFRVNAMNGEQIGAVTKLYGGFVKEAYTNADTFAVNFPMDLDVKMKAALLGAALFIDFLQFEEVKK